MENFTLEYINKYPKETKRLLGIDFDHLQLLIEQGKILHRRKQEEIENKKTRVNKQGGGNNPKLSTETQIILMLVYLRHNITFQLLGLMFQVSESTAHNIFTYWQQLFGDELPPSLLEQVKESLKELEDVQEKLTESELIVDSSEQEIERPSDYDSQKEHYSGKKKMHTLKSQLIVLPKMKDIVDVVVGKAGPTSDIKICRESLNKFDKRQLFCGDKAYVGEDQITTPQKKPKGGELTKEQKESNKVCSSKRIYVEHLIRLIKIFKIMGERFRLSKSRYKSVYLTICGLVRIRIGALFLELKKDGDSDKTIEVIMRHSFL
jgi:hypothetical protein